MAALGAPLAEAFPMQIGGQESTFEADARVAVKPQKWTSDMATSAPTPSAGVAVAQKGGGFEVLFDGGKQPVVGRTSSNYTQMPSLMRKAWEGARTDTPASAPERPEPSVAASDVVFKLEPSAVVGGPTRGVFVLTGQPVWVRRIKPDEPKLGAKMLQELKARTAEESSRSRRLFTSCFVGVPSPSERNIILEAQELMDLGSMKDLLRRRDRQGVPSEMLAYVARQVLEGLCHMHELQELYRDLSLSKVLHNRRGGVKLAAVDVPTIRKWKQRRAMGGRLDRNASFSTYLAPERCLEQEYCTKADVWSLGVISYELATGIYPFQAKSFLAHYALLTDAPEPRLDAVSFPEAACDFVAQCLVRDVDARATSQSLQEHDFVRSGVGAAQFAAWLDGQDGQ